MKVIKGASGFGDSIYLRAITEWLIKNRPEKYVVLTRYPEVFTGLDVILSPFLPTNKVDYYCSYVSRKESKYSQWKDILKEANLPIIPLTSNLKQKLPTKYKVLAIHPYNPMNNVSPSLPMKPYEKEFYNLVNSYTNVYILDKELPFLDLVKLFNESELVITQVGWAVALAEILDRFLIGIFTERALNSNNKFISTIKPHKVITKPTSTYIIMK